MTRTVRVRCEVDKRNILLLNSLIDSYEGLAIVRTVDSSSGRMVMYSTEDVYERLLDVINALNKEGIPIRNISTELSEEIDRW
ncbi:DUF4911 domain-containing protein [Limisalsivibrio acetivorans]|uniref:DUF4911 domain-containing protein n=1 Tax=Limisalsivibrio acetivorans TaxID=1304888 RepID=UPI0003B52C8E|nr:DUF4911 domain-containing protein [Limisalsivibrio acetivorans]